MIHSKKTIIPIIKKNIFLIILFLTALSGLHSCTSSEGSDIKTEDPERAYSIAKSRYDKGDYRSAVEDFSFIKLKFSGSGITDKAQYYLGMSYINLKEYVLGAYEFESLLKNYPTSKLTIDARFQLAMCYYYLSPDYRLDQTYTRYAIDEFQTFLDIYPKNALASKAEERIKELKNKLALKAFKSAEQYQIQENYKSALFYYDFVVNEYIDTEYADDALLSKIQLLISRKRYNEAKRDIARFEELFKSSPLYRNVHELKGRIP